MIQYVFLLLLPQYCNSISTGTVRLYRNGVPDTSQSWSSGIVQIYYSSQWGNICDDSSFGSDEADVICNQLGYLSVSSYSNTGNINNTFGVDPSNALMDKVNCSTFTYLAITQCSFSTNINSSCTNSNDVTVTCSSTRVWFFPFTGDIRLTGGTYSNQGLLEVYCNGRWGTVCDESFNTTQAMIACRQLGYNSYHQYGNIPLLQQINSRTISLRDFDDISCSSGSTCLIHCSSCSTAEGNTQCAGSISNYVTLECEYNITGSKVQSFTTDSCNTDVTGPTDPSVGFTLARLSGVIAFFLAFILVGTIFLVITLVSKYKKRRRMRELMRRYGDWNATMSTHDDDDATSVQSEPTQPVNDTSTVGLRNMMEQQTINPFTVRSLVPPRGEPPSYNDAVELIGLPNEDTLVPSQPLPPAPQPLPPPPPPSPPPDPKLLAHAPPTYRDVTSTTV